MAGFVQTISVESMVSLNTTTSETFSTELHLQTLTCSLDQSTAVEVLTSSSMTVHHR